MATIGGFMLLALMGLVIVLAMETTWMEDNYGDVVHRAASNRSGGRETVQRRTVTVKGRADRVPVSGRGHCHREVKA